VSQLLPDQQTLDDHADLYPAFAGVRVMVSSRMHPTRKLRRIG
jgi:hypothetical protein